MQSIQAGGGAATGEPAITVQSGNQGLARDGGAPWYPLTPCCPRLIFPRGRRPFKIPSSLSLLFYQCARQEGISTIPGSISSLGLSQ